MCKKCGCNTCETKIRGPLLTEGLISKSLISENLQYHIDKNIPLMENVFRIGSDAHLSMIKEARKLYSRGVLDLCEEDEGLMETHIGEFDLYENEIVPLDLPMLEENYSPEFKIGDFVQPIEGATSYLSSYDDNDINNKRILSKYVGQIEDVYINKPENLEMKDGEYLYSVANLNNSEIHSAYGFKESALELISDPTDYIKSLTSYRRLNETNKISSDKLSKLIPNLPKGYVGKNAGIGKYTISTPDGNDIVLTNSKDKKNWFYEPSNVALKILNESDSNYPDFDLNKNIRYQDTSISSGMWRYTGTEQGGKGVYRNLNNDQILGFDRSDFDIFRKNLSSHFDILESLNEIDYDKAEQLDENKVIDYIKNQGKEVVANLKAKIQKVITTAKEEGGETLQMVKLLAKQKRGTKLTPQESKLVSDQGKDLLKMAFTGLGAASGFGAIVSVLPATATISALIAAINFLDLDDELLKYTDSSKDSSRGLTSVEKDKANFKDIGGVKYIKYDVVEPYLDQADAVAESLQETIKKVLDEKKAKKKKKKDPPIGKPKRGGSKAYYVYVRDPKTKKIKKVSFGSGGLRAKIRNPKARKAFAARHNCKNKKDRTKAGYWSCNLPRYAPALGLGAKMNTFW